MHLAERHLNNESSIIDDIPEEEERASSLSDYFIAVCMVGNGVDIFKTTTIEFISFMDEFSHRFASHIADFDHVERSWSPLFRQLIP